METKGNLSEECRHCRKGLNSRITMIVVCLSAETGLFEHECERVSEDANLMYKGQRKIVFQVVLRTGFLTLCEVGPY